MIVSIVGSGSIGLGWAIVFSRAGHTVKICDVDQARLEFFWTELNERLFSLAESDLLHESPETITSRISTTLDIAEAVEGAMYIQECATEKIDVKRSLLETLERVASQGSIIASSSSALKVSTFANGLASRERCMIVHPGNPPYLLNVCEIVPADFTDPNKVRIAREFLESCGLQTILVKKEIDGFVFNRLQGAILREAYCLVRDGVVDPIDIDVVMTEGLGKRWAILGPFGTSALNVEGGIRAHAARMADSYYQMGLERGEDDPWTPELINAVAEGVEPTFPNKDWSSNVRKRDKALMEITKLSKESRFFKFYSSIK